MGFHGRAAAIFAGGLLSVAAADYFGRRRKLHLESPTSMHKSQDTRHIALWKPPTRTQMLEQLQSGQEFDLLVIGGGATGTGVALDAASRGLKVALVERDDFASGTSSRSTKLVHGGVRYLEKAFWNLDREQYDLVQEALSERHTVLKVAPYLATQLPIMCPIYKWWHLPYYYAGTKMYDWVAGKRGLESSYFLTRTRALQEFPMLKKENLIGAVVYYDGQQNDSRMNVVLAMTAAYYGASLGNHVEVTSLTKRKLEGKKDQIAGAVVRDEMTGKTWEIKAKGVVNATGPFVDGIRKMDDPNCVNIIAPSAGTHIVLPHYYSPSHMGLIDPATSDGRVIFFLPWEGNTVAGTTDAPTSITYQPKPTDVEVDFILNEVSHYLSPDIMVRRGDVLAAWSGIRPLVRNPKATNTQSLVRSHLIDVSDGGLLTVAGGKWTTYRKMSEEAVDKAIEVFELTPLTGCQTENVLLIGSHDYNPNTYIRLIQHYGMETEVAEHLLHNYGDRAFSVAALASLTGRRWPIMGQRLSYPYLFIEAEVRYAARYEWACTAVDVLARRTRLAFLNAQAALEALPRIVKIMAEELNWNEARQKKEMDEAITFLQTMGLDTSASRSHFKSEEIMFYRQEFYELDKDGDGTINTQDLRHLFARTAAKKVSPETLKKIIEEVEMTKNGVIGFDEFLTLMMNTDEIKRQPSFGELSKPSATERSGGGI